MSKLGTVNDIVSALEEIVQTSMKTKNRAGYFAALYKRMTTAVGEGISKGQFTDGKRMEQLVIVFAERYLSAHQAHQRKEQLTQSWQNAFNQNANDSLIVLQHLVLGINTHINLDLAIAAAAVAPGDEIHSLEKDFNHINVVIASLVDDVQQCLEEVWFPMRFLRSLVNSHGKAVLHFSIETARSAAWTNAVLLAKLDRDSAEKHVRQMDFTVNTIAHRIIRPGFWPQLLLRFIRLTEYNDVARTIRLIDTTVVV